jgi:hypothetical protein
MTCLKVHTNTAHEHNFSLIFVTGTQFFKIFLGKVSETPFGKQFENRLRLVCLCGCGRWRRGRLSEGHPGNGGPERTCRRSRESRRGDGGTEWGSGRQGRWSWGKGN